MLFHRSSTFFGLHVEYTGLFRSTSTEIRMGAQSPHSYVFLRAVRRNLVGARASMKISVKVDREKARNERA